jgi:phage repressor protein C with HTH and peptisase S24 domain
MKPADRLRDVVDFLKTKHGLTNDRLSLRLGYKSKGYVSDLLGSHKEINHLFLDRLRLNYNVNPDYILDGVGAMLLNKESKKIETDESGVDDNSSMVNEPYLIQRRRQKGQDKPFLVPLVPFKAQAGYARSYGNIDFINTLEMYPILPGIDPTGALWRYFEVQGDSMEPGLFERDLVLVSMVPHDDWTDVKKEQVYVIVTDEEVLIKLIFPVDREAWILRSSNKRHKDRKIDVKDIKELWYFRRLVSTKLQWQKK